MLLLYSFTHIGPGLELTIVTFIQPWRDSFWILDFCKRAMRYYLGVTYFHSLICLTCCLLCFTMIYFDLHWKKRCKRAHTLLFACSWLFLSMTFHNKNIAPWLSLNLISLCVWQCLKTNKQTGFQKEKL